MSNPAIYVKSKNKKVLALKDKVLIIKWRIAGSNRWPFACHYSSHPDFKAVIKKIEELSYEIIFQYHLAKRNGIENISMETIKQSVLKKDVRKVQVKLLEFIDTYIEKLEKWLRERI